MNGATSVSGNGGIVFGQVRERQQWVAAEVAREVARRRRERGEKPAAEFDALRAVGDELATLRGQLRTQQQEAATALFSFPRT